MSEPVPCVACGGLYVPRADQRWCSSVCREVSAERASVAAYLRAQAEAGGDPWMSHVADEVEAGAHRRQGAYRG
jgi:hypothetical protein